MLIQARTMTVFGVLLCATATSQAQPSRLIELQRSEASQGRTATIAVVFSGGSVTTWVEVLRPDHDPIRSQGRAEGVAPALLTQLDAVVRANLLPPTQAPPSPADATVYTVRLENGLRRVRGACPKADRILTRLIEATRVVATHRGRLELLDGNLSLKSGRVVTRIDDRTGLGNRLHDLIGHEVEFDAWPDPSTGRLRPELLRSHTTVHRLRITPAKTASGGRAIRVEGGGVLSAEGDASVVLEAAGEEPVRIDGFVSGSTEGRVRQVVVTAVHARTRAALPLTTWELRPTGERLPAGASVRVLSREDTHVWVEGPAGKAGVLPLASLELRLPKQPR